MQTVDTVFNYLFGKCGSGMMLCEEFRTRLLMTKLLGIKTLPFIFVTTSAATLWLYTVSMWRNPFWLDSLHCKCVMPLSGLKSLFSLDV